jgi:hypothetical protein
MGGVGGGLQSTSLLKGEATNDRAALGRCFCLFLFGIGP